MNIGDAVEFDFPENVWVSGNRSYDGKDVVIIIHFWSLSCPSCHLNMPDLQKIRDKYISDSLEVIAIHRPMSEYDLDLSRVRAAVVELGITEPCALDNDHKIDDALGVDAWPTYFLFDKDGKMRRHAKGQFGVKMIEQALIRLFDEETALEKEKSPEAVTESFPLSF